MDGSEREWDGDSILLTGGFDLVGLFFVIRCVICTIGQVGLILFCY